ncbi:MAG: preprotein translocase subunit SecE [Gammaproteobacteria bacterium]
MNKKTGTSSTLKSSSWDGVKWGVVLLLIIAGLWANYYYSQIDWPLRLVGWILLACLAVLISSRTAFGRKTWRFFKDARGELRKVVWPTRQETFQTTALIIVLVIIMALLLWGVDSLLLWIIGLLMGQRG